MLKKIRRVLWGAAWFLSACSTLQKTPAINLNLSDDKALEAYSRVLANYVNKEGEVDFEGLQKDPKDLFDYVGYVAQKKFSEIGNPEQLLAHHLNAYNALSMYTVLQKGIPKSNSGLSKLFFFRLTKMEIGGQIMSLEAYEKNFIRSIGEDRVHWALNCMSVSCPRLPQEPFLPETLESRLQAAAVEFFNSDKNVKIDDERKEVAVSEILKFFPEDFVPKKAPTVATYVNLYRQSPLPMNYEIRYISYDWTINNSRRHR